MSTERHEIRGFPFRSVAPVIHGWLVPALTHGEDTISVRLVAPRSANCGALVMLPAPLAAGVVQDQPKVAEYQLLEATALALL